MSEAPKLKPTNYLEAVGRRKTSVARVRLFTRGGKEILINKKPLEQYFPSFVLRQVVLSPLEMMGCLDTFTIQVVLKGGGFSSQAEAIRHGLTRALVLFNPDFRKRLKRAGFLTRDPRMRERKKFGLKRARRAPQWAKR
ncbi:MAG: 30S ribosomal protein S9 [bacterium]|nr:30S ribosomal protein S9 [bacterium]